MSSLTQKDLLLALLSLDAYMRGNDQDAAIRGLSKQVGLAEVEASKDSGFYAVAYSELQASNDSGFGAVAYAVEAGAWEGLDATTTNVGAHYA